VAQGESPDRVFAAVAEEVGALFGADAAVIVRFEPDGEVTILGCCGAEHWHPGWRGVPNPDYALASVQATGRGARRDTADQSPGAPAVGLQAAMATETGLSSLSVPLAPARGWTVASWLIGHAADYKIAGVSYLGQQWKAETGTWTADPTAGDQIQLSVSATGIKS